MASLKTSVITNVLGQLYVAAIGIVMVPAYVRYMGIEAYGLIGFFIALQTWFALLDMGISPTLIREISRFRAGAASREEVWLFIRSAEWLFLLLGVLSCTAIVLCSSWISLHWLRLQEIGVAEAANCIAMMGAMVGVRWLASLYRSGLTGMDCLPVVNLSAVVLATLRSFVVLAVLAWYSQRIEVFFAYQMLIAALEVLLLRRLFLLRFPGMELAPFWPRFRSLGLVFRFAGAMALLALIWGVISQADRLVLSHYLSLAAYGSYAVAMVAASGVSLLATPLIQAVQPRMVFLAAGENAPAVHELYRTSTQLLMCLLLVVAGSAAVFAEPILRVWTGNAALAAQMAPVLALYALGNALLALSSLIFQLQYACGLVRRHVLGSLGFGVIWVPLMCLIAIRHGAIGTAWAWFAGNLLFFILWMLGTQRRLMPGQTMNWLWADVLRGPLAAAPVYLLFIFALPLAVGRLGVAMEIGACAILAALTGMLASPRLRAQAGAGWRRYRVSAGKRIDE